MWMNHTIKEAIDCGRLHHQLLPDFVFGEEVTDAVKEIYSRAVTDSRANFRGGLLQWGRAPTVVIALKI